MRQEVRTRASFDREHEKKSQLDQTRLLYA